MSSTWKTLRGNTTSNNLRTCETVIVGAFFFQPDLQMPEEEMGQHTRQHVMVPPRVFPPFIVIHPEVGFRFLEALFDRPPDPTEPDQQAQRDTQGGVAQVVPVPRMRPEGALHEQPHGRGRLSVLTQQEPF